MVELRSESCTGSYVNCGGYISSESTTSLSKAGINSIYLEAHAIYVIFVAPKSGGTLSSGTLNVEIGLASSSGGDGGSGSGGGSGGDSGSGSGSGGDSGGDSGSSGSGGNGSGGDSGGESESSSNNASLDALAYQVLLMIVVPCAIFGLALLIAIALCCRDGRVKSYQEDLVIPGSCGTSSLVKMRRLAIATWLFSILLLVSTWAVVWSSLAYLLALITFVLSAIIHRAANSANFAQTRVAENASWYKDALLLCGIILIVNLFVVIVELIVMFVYDDPHCNSTALPENNQMVVLECFVLYTVHPAYGLAAMIGTISLIAVAIPLGWTVVDIESHDSSSGNGAVEDAFDRRVAFDREIALPPEYPQAEVVLEEYPQAEIVVDDYPQAEMVQFPQAVIVQLQQLQRQREFEILRE